jgi:hypothetical protein
LCSPERRATTIIGFELPLASRLSTMKFSQQPLAHPGGFLSPNTQPQQVDPFGKSRGIWLF